MKHKDGTSSLVGVDVHYQGGDQVCVNGLSPGVQQTGQAGGGQVTYHLQDHLSWDRVAWWSRLEEMFYLVISKTEVEGGDRVHKPGM